MTLVAPGAPAARHRVDVRPCWNEIGTQGEATCPELLKVIHCRNCPVYSQAAVRLLDRPLLPDYRREWTECYAQPKQLAASSRTSVLLFRIHAEWLALPTLAFQEIAEHRLVHSLPHRRQGLVLGLVNIRGELLICVSLGHLLGAEQASPSHAPRRSYDRLLVANWAGNRLVFPADEVCGIHRFERSDLREPPATVAKSNPTYTQGLVSWQGKTAG